MLLFVILNCIWFDNQIYYGTPVEDLIIVEKNESVNSYLITVSNELNNNLDMLISPLIKEYIENASLSFSKVIAVGSEIEKILSFPALRSSILYSVLYNLVSIL